MDRMLILLATVFAVATAGTVTKREFTKVQWEDCGSHLPSNAVELFELDVDPMPTIIPGNVTATFRARTTKVVTQATLKVKITKMMFANSVPLEVPCLSDWGSCTYDGCSLLEYFRESGCPKQLEDYGIPCTCPFPVGDINLPKQIFEIGALPTVLNWLKDGDYAVEGQITDPSDSDAVLGCVKAKFTIASPKCSGFFGSLSCLLGY